MNRLIKLIALLISIITMLFALGCGGGSGNQTPKNSKRVGVNLHTKTEERYIRDGIYIKTKLEALGYTVDLQYADNDVQAQLSQIENMITTGANCLVIDAIDSKMLVNVLERAKANKIPVIAYDRLLMDTDSVSYYATFDNREVGRCIAKYVETKLGLAEGKGPYNIELFAGSPDDNNSYMLNGGVLDILKPYLDNGQLVIPSGQVDFNTICTLSWSQEGAQKRMENIISGFYSQGQKLDAVISPYDGISYGIAAALEGAGFRVGSDRWPLITGQDAEILAIKNILSGRQSSTIFKDTRLLADKCTTMIQAVLEGQTPEINDTTTYNNHKLTVPTYLCPIVSIDKDNVVKELVDTGYYKKSDLGL